VNLAVNQVALSPGSKPDPNWTPAALSARRATESRASWARDVARALETLGPDERCFIQLSYIDGLHHDEIARQVGKPVSTVSRTIALGMQRLAPLLERA
jgi:RNA polymerase sigma factor (sigma-70 family)